MGDENYQPLFAYGYGLSVKDQQTMRALSEEVDPAVSQINDSRFLYAGDPVQPWRLVLNDAGGNTQVSANSQASSLSKLFVKATDNKAQEDTIQATWSGAANLSIQGNPVDLTTKTAQGMALTFDYNVLEQGANKVTLSSGCGLECAGELDITASLKSKAGQGWQQAHIALSCFAKAGSNMKEVNIPFLLAANTGLKMQLSEIKLVAAENPENCEL
jgi:beta-glucosidase